MPATTLAFWPAFATFAVEQPEAQADSSQPGLSHVGFAATVTALAFDAQLDSHQSWPSLDAPSFATIVALALAAQLDSHQRCPSWAGAFFATVAAFFVFVEQLDAHEEVSSATVAAFCFELHAVVSADLEAEQFWAVAGAAPSPRTRTAAARPWRSVFMDVRRGAGSPWESRSATLGWFVLGSRRVSGPTGEPVEGERGIPLGCRLPDGAT
ncbi:MAG: hypothetical protein AAF726_15535 [Planctomycetota bacterium]